MVLHRRLLAAAAAALGGLATAAFVSTAFAHADPCDLGECTLVSGGDPTDVVYKGFRPLFADWRDDQPTNVEVTQGDKSSVAGSYDVKEFDYESKVMDHAEYKFGDFTPSASNTTGIDSDDLAGTKVNDFWTGPFGTDANGDPTFHTDTLNIFYGDGAHTEVTTVSGEYTNFLIGDGHATGDWILEAGQTTPRLLWDSLPNSEFPTSYIADLLQNVLPPDDWFPLGNADLGAPEVANLVAEFGSVLDPGVAADVASSLLP
jgi:hypothetical protein